MKVLVTGSRAPVALELAWRFSRAGHSVFQADSLTGGMAMRSNCVQRSFIVPCPVDGLDAYTDAIARIINDEQIELLIPTCEEVFFLAAGSQRLPCRVLCADHELLARIHNKWTFSQFASNQFATVPETQRVDANGGFGGLAGLADDPAQLVFKPVYSRFASQTLIGPSSQQISNTDFKRVPWIAQQRIFGTEYSTWSVAIDGQLTAHCAYQSLYRVGVGSGICFQPVDPPDIEHFVSQFVQDCRYTGQIGFDFIRDADQKLWVLEGNPRATSGAQLFAKSDAVVDALLGNTESIVKPSSDRPAMIEFAMPIWGLVDTFRNGRLLKFIPDVLRSRWLNFSLRDPWPALGLPVSLWHLARIAVREKCSLQQASTFDIEWNGEIL